MGDRPEPDVATLVLKMEMPEDKIRKIFKTPKSRFPWKCRGRTIRTRRFHRRLAYHRADRCGYLRKLRGATADILDSLTQREAKVLRMRFGIEMNTDHTLEEVGKQFDVTRERIRKIEAKALRKLRHPSRSERLKSFLDSEG